MSHLADQLPEHHTNFHEYFEQHFGKRPVPRDQDAELREAIAAYLSAADLARRCREWDEKEAAARSGWYARDPELEHLQRKVSRRA